MRYARLLPVLALCALACSKETPQTVVREDLGITVTFPGPALRNTHEEDTPYGRITWFDVIHVPKGSMADSFHVEVGNLPDGTQGGTTPQAVLDTFQKWVTYRMEGKIEVSPVAGAAGPGLRYRATGYTDRGVAGIVILRRGRLHHAQATVSDPKDPRLAAFLDSLKVQ